MKRTKLLFFGITLIAVLEITAEEPIYHPLLIESDSALYELREEQYLQDGILPEIFERPLSYSAFQAQIKKPTAVRLPLAQSYFLYEIQLNTEISTTQPADMYIARNIDEFVYAEDGLLDLNGDGIPETPQTTDNYNINWGFVGTPKSISQYTAYYAAWKMPSPVKIDASIISGPFGVSYSQDIRPSFSNLSNNRGLTNVPLDINVIDVNFPYRTYINYYSDGVEASFGRDRLQSGPGRHSLTLNEQIPYYDYIRLRLKTGAISHTTYLIRLNPVLSSGEMQYINYLYDNWNEDSFVEPNASWNPRTFDQSKHYILSKLSLSPLNWLHFDFTQMHLVGGRVPQLPDFNPLMVYHNLYEEGQYSVPVSFAIALLPIDGLKLFGELLIYDLEFGNETISEDSTNPNALAYEVGITYVTPQLKKPKNGYFRFDYEWNYVMPWTYVEESSYRNMTSRVVFTDPYNGRKWVDFPLGFYLGPDSFESCFSALLRKGRWNVRLEWTFTGKGSVYLEGYGPSSPIANKALYSQNGLLTEKPNERITYENDISITGNIALPVRSGELSLTSKLGVHHRQNISHVPGRDDIYPVAAIGIQYKR